MAGTSDGSCVVPTPCQPPPRTDGKVREAKMPTFTIFDGVFMVTSMVTFLVDVGTGEVPPPVPVPHCWDYVILCSLSD